MLTSCLTTAISTKSASDILITLNKKIEDENLPFELDEALETKLFTVKNTSMTKQLTLSSPTTNPNCTNIPNAGNATTTPITEPAISVISPNTHPDLNAIDANDCNDAKTLQRSSSNCVTLLPNHLTTSGLVTLTSASDVSSSGKASSDASGRSAALERAYVHDVYENCEEPTGPIRPRIAQFLNNLEPGSVVCDVGCGNGRYLAHGNPAICTVGVDRCYRLSKVARDKGAEVMLCDNLELPFRDDSFDAVLSLAVVHHFATTERRVSALRELARILRIGGRVVITVWALEQRHRRFESQDVLIPWQPPKIRNLSCSDEEDDDSFLPPYHAYTEDSTNSSRSAGDGDSSSLSSSSPGESCYSFVRRAIQKLAGGRRHPWFLDSWTSKETKNDSLDFEDVKDLPIELRRLEDFDDFHDPPLSAGLKSRSLGSILYPPPRQIVRSRSSVPSLGGTAIHSDVNLKSGTSNTCYSIQNAQHLQAMDNHSGAGGISTTNNVSPTKVINTANVKVLSSSTSLGRRPKLIKQKQSICDEEYQLPENPFHMISTYNSINNSVSSNLYLRGGCYYNSRNISVSSQSATTTNSHNFQQQSSLTAQQMMQASMFLRKQSSLNEELMAVNRLREKERVRKRIQKQTSLNEAFLCRSAIFSKKLQVIRENFSKKMKTSSGSFERTTKTGLNKLVHNLSSYIAPDIASSEHTEKTTSETVHISETSQTSNVVKCNKYHHHHHHHHMQQQLQQQQSLNLQNYQRKQGIPILAHEKASPTTTLQKQLSLGSGVNKYAGPVTYCNSPECATSACYCSTYHYTGCNTFCTTSDVNGNKEDKVRRHSRESGSDSSKDSSLQSDTSIESEDSFASVIFIPKPEQHQQQLNYQQQHHNSNSSSSNSSSSNGGSSGTVGGCHAYGNCCQHKNSTCKLKSNGNPISCITCLKHQQHANHQRLSSAPTSPLIMPCPPTPAHSPAATQAAVTSPPQTVATVTAAMAILTPPSNISDVLNEVQNSKDDVQHNKKEAVVNRFSFDEAHIKQHENIKKVQVKETNHKEENPEAEGKITRQIIKNLPPIPKFRKQQSLQIIRQNFPIVRRSSGTGTTCLPSIPKLMSLELFNPATDDLDSDSSEASTPNSIDSVISTTSKPIIMATANSEKTEIKTQSSSEKVECNKNDESELEQNIKLKKQQYCNGELKINNAMPHNIFLNEADSYPIPPARGNVNTNSNSLNKRETDCIEFAEQLNVHLLRKIEEKNTVENFENPEFNGEPGDQLEINFTASGESLGKKRINELRDFSTIREELRERRLMLANLSIQPSLQQSPASSTSSLSSQTRSFTIHEENEEESDERSYSLQLYENCKISKINYKRNRSYNLNPETAYLLQDDGEIFEEEEEEEEEEVVKHIRKQMEPKIIESDIKAQNKTDSRRNKNTIRYDSWESEGTIEKEDNTNLKEKEKNMNTSQHKKQSTESWGNSNSSTGSLESPSQGGATTHHRYYHVFREGELDALINHHVASLHIVSSYYERASWCVVAEKVQVWTI